MVRAREGSRAREEHGFTLVEMLVAVSILGLAATGLAATLGVGVRAAGDVSDRVSASAAGRSLAIYLPPDVQSAETAVATPTGAGISCNGVANPRLQLRGADGFDVVYGIRLVTEDYVLERSDCSSGTAGETIVVSRHLAGVDAVEATTTQSGATLLGASLRITAAVRAGETPVVTTVAARRRSS